LETHDFLAGLAVLAGLVGIVVVVLPGLLLQVGAVALWAFEESNAVAWTVLALVLVVAVAGSILKYLYPGRRLREAGIPGWLLLVAVLTAIVGLFVVPLLGAPIGFVLAIYVFERSRKGKAAAWPSTRAALRAVFTSIGIELAGGFLIALMFFAGALLT
jgi:uncharacterized protein YqgC (DUF456 family)